MGSRGRTHGPVAGEDWVGKGREGKEKEGKECSRALSLQTTASGRVSVERRDMRQKFESIKTWIPTAVVSSRRGIECVRRER